MVHNTSRQALWRRLAAWTLLVAGGLVILFALPLWFWLAVLGAGSVAVGWLLLGANR